MPISHLRPTWWNNARYFTSGSHDRKQVATEQLRLRSFLVGISCSETDSVTDPLVYLGNANIYAVLTVYRINV